MVKFSRSLLPAYVYVYILWVCEQERERVLEREPVCVRVPVCVCVMFQLPFSPCLSSQNSGLWPWLQMKQRMFGWVST